MLEHRVALRMTAIGKWRSFVVCALPSYRKRGHIVSYTMQNWHWNKPFIVSFANNKNCLPKLLTFMYAYSLHLNADFTKNSDLLEFLFCSMILLSHSLFKPWEHWYKILSRVALSVNISLHMCISKNWYNYVCLNCKAIVKNWACAISTPFWNPEFLNS